MNRNAARETYEHALIAIAKATDGNGVPVRLLLTRDLPTAQQLRQDASRFIGNFDALAMHIKSGSDGRLIQSQQVEAAWWTNLALLARATAAALHLES